jgi:hypothetical protein
LAGEAADEDVDVVREVILVDVPNVTVDGDVRPVFAKYPLGFGIVLDERYSLESTCGLKAEGEAADSRKEVDGSELVHR